MTLNLIPGNATGARNRYGVALNQKPHLIKKLKNKARDFYDQTIDLVRGRERDLPSLIIAGGMRCGTTALFSYLANHPELSASRKKEVHYFDLHYHRGIDWYKRQFHANQIRPEGAARLLFESSPYYMFEPRAPKRIRESLPNIKIIFLLRDPIERAVSQYQKNIRDGRELLALAEAMAAEEKRLHGEENRLLSDAGYQSQIHQHFSYKARGHYSKLLHRYYQHIPKEQILVIHSGSLFKNPTQAFNKICTFASIHQWCPDQFPVVNSSHIKAILDSSLRQQLEHEFEPYEQELEQLIGWRSASWPRRAC